MKHYQLHRGRGLAGLACSETTESVLLPHQARIGVHAVALNFRDLEIVRGGAPTDAAITPCSDGAGVVLECGAAVTRWRVGDRVAANFFPCWTDGPSNADKIAGSLGNRGPGMLAESVVLPGSALFALPDSLDFAQASTLPCAGVTAWNALFESGQARAGQTVLLLGTGGVSVWALQLAKAAGLRVLMTSSGDDKLARVRQLGADHAINYRDNPQWQRLVLEYTGGRGADLVVDTAGQTTLATSMAAARHGGRVVVVGGTSGWSAQIDIDTMVGSALQLAGVLVGSRSMAQKLAAFVEQQQLRPVIDRVFAFDEAAAAFDYLAHSRHVGKVVIDVARRGGTHD